MKTQIRFGTVQWFDAQTNSGGVKISGEPVEADFSLETPRCLIAGVNAPEFGKSASTDLYVPDKGVELACVVEVGYKLEVGPSHRTLRRNVKVVAWDLLESYREIEQAIASRPVYEVVEFVLYNGNPTSGNQRRVIATGTMQELQAVYPHGAEKDPLAPEFKVLDFIYRRRFYRLTPDGKKIQCPDTRQLEWRIAQKSFHPTNEQGEFLASQEDIAWFVHRRKTERERECVLA